MMASTEAATPLSAADAEKIVASIASKIHEGREDVLPADLEQLRRVVDAMSNHREHKVIPRLDREYLLGSSTPTDATTIVRFRGMVQDMLDSEYYLTRVDGVKTKYRDYFSHASSDNSNEMDIAHNLAERQLLVVVPVPFAPSRTGLDVRDTDESQQEDTAPSGVKQRGNNKRPFQSSSPSDENPDENPRQDKENNNDEHNMSSSSSPARKQHHPEILLVEDSPSGGDDAVSPVSLKNDESPSQGAAKSTAMSDDAPVAPGASTNSSVDWWPAGYMGSDPNQCPVLAKMYYDDDDNQASQRLRLNDVVELTGVLSMNPLDADFTEQQSGGGGAPATPGGTAMSPFLTMEDLCDRLVLPPPSLLPRLHMLCYKRIDLDEEMNHPTSSSSTQEMELMGTTTTTENALQQEKDDRALTIQALSKYVFDGNDIAAEALLMVLLSVAEREKMNQCWSPVKTPDETTLGCASLNLVLDEASSCAKLYQKLQCVLAEIIPVVGTANMTRTSLNDDSLVSPAKNETGKLVASPLQLPKGSALIINQGNMTEGQISPRGQETSLAMSSLTKNHWVPYRFEGMMKFNFEADYRVIVLSFTTSSPSSGSSSVPPKKECKQTQGGSKLLPCAMKMNIASKISDGIVMDVVDEDDLGDSSPVMPLELRNRIRSYLARCRGNSRGDNGGATTNIALSKEVLEETQKDFVQRRIERRAAMERRRMEYAPNGNSSKKLKEIGEEDFHRWLTLTRLQARSRMGLGGANGETPRCACVDDWKAALCLDDAMGKTEE